MRTYEEVVSYYNTDTPANVEVVFIENEEVFVSGWFNPNWFEDGENTAVLVEVRAPAGTVVEEHIVNEVVTTINHELVHNEQHEQGRFVEDYQGEYADNPNEQEAYAREAAHEFYN